MGNLVIKQIHDNSPNSTDYYTNIDTTDQYTIDWRNNKFQIIFNSDFEQNTIYHIGLYLNITQTEHQQTIPITIQLKNNNNIIQFLQKQELNSNFNTYYLEFIFQPLVENLNTILLKFSNSNNNITDIIIYDNIIKLYKLTNQFKTNNKIKKLGLLGESSDGFCINGEVLYLPKDGIYEINDNDLEIKSFYKIGTDIYNSYNTVTIKPFTLNYIEEINN